MITVFDETSFFGEKTWILWNRRFFIGLTFQGVLEHFQWSNPESEDRFRFVSIRRIFFKKKFPEKEHYSIFFHRFTENKKKFRSKFLKKIDFRSENMRISYQVDHHKKVYNIWMIVKKNLAKLMRFWPKYRKFKK